MDLLVLVLGFWVLCGLAAGIALSNKGRSGLGGFLLGLLLGPIGLVLALVMKGDQAALDERQLRAGQARRCPACAELVRMEALKCKHCAADMPPPDVEEAEIRRRSDLVEKAFLTGICAILLLAILGFLS